MASGNTKPLYNPNPFEVPSSLLPNEEQTAVSPQIDTLSVLNQLAETMLHIFNATSVYICDWQEEINTVTVIVEKFGLDANEKEKVSDLGVPYRLDEHNFSLRWLNEDEAYYFHFDDPNQPIWDREHMVEYDCKTNLVIPLIIDDHIVGFAEIWESREKKEYTVDELKLAKQLAQQITITLLNTYLYHAEAQRRRESEIVQEIAGYLTSTLNLDEVLSRVIDILRSYLANIDSCSLSELTPNGRFLKVRKTWAEKKDYLFFPDGRSIELEKTFISNHTIQQKEATVISDLRDIPFANERLKNIIDKGLRSVLYVPLLIKDNPIGILHIGVWNTPRKFAPEEVALTKAVANQAAIAIENANLFAAERQQLKLSQTLQQVGGLLTSSLGLHEVYERIFDLLENVVSYNSVSVQLLDEKTNKFSLDASRGFGNVELVREIIFENSEYLINQIPNPPGWHVIPDTAQDEGWLHVDDIEVRSWIGASLFIKDKMIGTLKIDSKIPYAYNDETGKTVAVFASQAAIAIENTRLYEKTRQQAEELALLHLLAQTTAVTLDIDELLRQTTELIAQKQYPYIFGFIMLNEEANILSPHPSYFGIDPKWENYAIPLDKSSISGLVTLTGKPYISGNVKNNDLYMEIDPETNSEITVPIFLKGKVIGVINVESPEKNAFNQKDFNFLMTLSVNVAAAIERTQLYNSLQDQTEALSQRVAEQTAKLQIEKDRTLAILESAGEGIVLTDTDSVIRYVNRTMELQTGYTKQELIGQTPQILNSGTNSEKTYEQMWKTITKNHRWAGELRNKRKDGSHYDIAITISPLVDESSQISGYVSVHSDISRLKEVDRLKAEFISNVSHELRTPLTNIKMYISLLERGKQENFSRYFKVLHQESDRLGRLIQGLLDISRLESSFNPDPNARLDIWPYLKQCAQVWQEESDKNQITIHLNIDDAENEQLFAKIEENHFINIINNLTENAIRFSPPETTITIAAGQKTIDDQSEIWIQIRDQGFGIPQHEQSKVYERFFRGQIAYERNIPGAGLGLAIVKETVEGYSGRIELVSNKKEGVTFTIWLPTAQSHISNL